MTKIAVLQMDASAENLSRAGELVAEAARLGADFAVLPELSNCPWLPAREEGHLLHAAETEDGNSVRAYREIAAKHRVNLIAPVYEEAGGFRYSTAFIIDRDGGLIGKYRKNHIPYQPGWQEKFYYIPGDSGYPVFEHEGLKFGVQICWDNMFVEGSRILALKGAQVIFSPRATGFGSLGRWRAVVQANATVNHLFVATANRVGEDRGVRFGGGSLIAGPKGDVISEVTTAAPGVALAEVDLEAIAGAREAEPFFANRRPNLYKTLVEG